MPEEEYELAIDKIGARSVETTPGDDPDEWLAKHIVPFYWRGPPTEEILR